MKLRTTLSVIAVCCLVVPWGFAAGVKRNEPIKPIPAVRMAKGLKVELGKMLFFEPRLSKSGFISCNSCHNLSTGGADNLPSSIGHKWQLGPINSPTVLNAKYNLAQFWDGRAKDLKDQAGGPIANPGEMASTHDIAIEVLKSMPEYADLFKSVYGSSMIDIDRVTDAIAVFEETLITPNSPFDKWLNGDDNAISPDAKAGYDQFKKIDCISCHKGIGVGGESYELFGVVKPYEKDTKTLGRYGVTKDDDDKYVFKVPLLRNISLTAPYFHDASTWDLKDAVKIMADYQMGIALTPSITEKIVTFLKALTGEQPKIVLPVLPPSTQKTPKPDRM